MAAIGDMGKIRGDIVVTNKFAAYRDKSLTTDGRDGMISLGKNNGNLKLAMEEKLKCRLSDDDIWRWRFKKRPQEYAVCHGEIRKHIQDKKAQIFVSNMSEIENARTFYADNIVILYLHATHATATRKHVELRRRDELEKAIRERLAKKKSIMEKDVKWEEVKYEFEGNVEIQKEFQEKVAESEEEIVEVHNNFCEHNISIDHVLLNTGTREDLIEQMNNLIDHYTSHG